MLQVGDQEKSEMTKTIKTRKQENMFIHVEHSSHAQVVSGWNPAGSWVGDNGILRILKPSEHRMAKNLREETVFGRHPTSAWRFLLVVNFVGLLVEDVSAAPKPRQKVILEASVKVWAAWRFTLASCAVQCLANELSNLKFFPPKNEILIFAIVKTFQSCFSDRHNFLKRLRGQKLAKIAEDILTRRQLWTLSA